MSQRESWSDSTLSALFDEAVDLGPDAQTRMHGPVDEEALKTWMTYHKIRHALGSDVGEAPEAFIQGFRLKLASEPSRQPLVSVSLPESPAAANDALFRWKIVAGLSACVTAGVLAWSGWGGGVQHMASSSSDKVLQKASFGAPYPPPAATLVGFSEAVLIRDDEPVSFEMQRDPSLDDLVRAHSVVSSSHPASFLRSTTFIHEGF